ncbi:iron-sulfur cluster biosynthesis transcriptional regulator SufR [Myroides odoratus]|uniref:Iron-sulfur cluster biosynthesis transcriptional regulator SufR n=2 Tax=Myroides odoratus TaxID=256 RepID=A0A378RIG4_MYROD|nr:transcriptional regulator [Myroides odoratus]STZ26812.1 iron-sulfur cluster biosynthesis transcriptional regulator SufR [Myroides odoratus]
MKKSSTDRILMQLKMRGEVIAADLADQLEITKEGARLQLQKLLKEGLVSAVFKSEGVGRPIAYYSLTDQGVAKFPDTHAQVTVEMIEAVRKLFGENALDLLITDREKKVYQHYETVIGQPNSIEELLNRLVNIRTQEGYMAEWQKEEDGTYIFIENHCPICAAATVCQGFCRSELNNFRQLMGSDFQVERIQYIISGAHRCTYRITKK